MAGRAGARILKGANSVDRLLDDFHESAGLQGPFRGHVGIFEGRAGLSGSGGENPTAASGSAFFPDHGWRNDLEGTG